jgi:nucleoid DNA-binding protein
MTLTKANLVDSIYEQLDFSKTKSAQLVESLLEAIKKALENGERVKRDVGSKTTY